MKKTSEFQICCFVTTVLSQISVEGNTSNKTLLFYVSINVTRFNSRADDILKKVFLISKLSNGYNTFIVSLSN